MCKFRTFCAKTIKELRRSGHEHSGRLTSETPSLGRAVIASFAPFSANLRAIAAPIPFEAPVIRDTFPCKSFAAMTITFSYEQGLATILQLWYFEEVTVTVENVQLTVTTAHLLKAIVATDETC